MFVKRSLVGSIILFCCLSEARIFLWPVLLKARGERSEEQSLELRANRLPSYGASYQFDQWLISVDRTIYSNSSESGNVSIETDYSELSLWGGYSLFSGDIWDFYANAGVGVYQQKVETTASGVSVSNGSQDKSLIGMGAEFLIRTPFYFSMITGGRLNWTEDLDPELMPEVYLKLGIGF